MNAFARGVFTTGIFRLQPNFSDALQLIVILKVAILKKILFRAELRLDTIGQCFKFYLRKYF